MAFSLISSGVIVISIWSIAGKRFTLLFQYFVFCSGVAGKKHSQTGPYEGCWRHVCRITLLPGEAFVNIKEQKNRGQCQDLIDPVAYFMACCPVHGLLK
jgi:hypothetical protein